MAKIKIHIFKSGYFGAFLTHRDRFKERKMVLLYKVFSYSTQIRDKWLEI